MLELYLIRHGESVMNKNGHIICGRSNHISLSPEGRFQAELLGMRFSSENKVFDKVFSSTANRAYETARIACNILRYCIEDIVLSVDLLELDQGDWEGKLRPEMFNDDVLARRALNYLDFKAPNGESQKDAGMRMLGFVEKNIVECYDSSLDKRFALYSHGMAIKCFLREVMDFSPKMTYKMVLGNASITRLKYDEKGWHVLGFNDVAHLK